MTDHEKTAKRDDEIASLVNKIYELTAEIAKLRARIAEQEGQIDRADEHTAKIMMALEAAERERDEFRQKRIRVSDLASHNLDEREKLLAEIATMTESRDNWRASCKQVEGERDAAFVRGLRRALETIRPMVSHKVLDAIQAEIAKAGKPVGK